MVTQYHTWCYSMVFLANVKLFAVARPSVCRLSSVTLVRPTQAVQIFGNGVWYLCHPLTSIDNFTEIVPWEPIRRGS